MCNNTIIYGALILQSVATA